MLASGVLKQSRAIYSEELYAFEKQPLVCYWALVDKEGRPRDSK